MKNKNTLIYIIGILTGLIAIPLIDSLMDVVYSWIEYLKILPSKLIINGNKELLELQGNEENEYETHVCGFEYVPEQEEYYGDDEE